MKKRESMFSFMQPGQTFSQSDTARVPREHAAAPVRIDVQRMAAALAEQSVAVPAGLSREEKRRLLMGNQGSF